MTHDHRAAAQARIRDLIAALRSSGSAQTSAILEECESLERAIGAFHMEGIRFRMYNVDRMLARAGGSVPSTAASLLEEARHHLEAAGFHTRSHQAPH